MKCNNGNCYDNDNLFNMDTNLRVPSDGRETHWLSTNTPEELNWE